AERTRRQVGPAIVAAWATSNIGFVAIGSSHVRALRDFSRMGCFGLTGAFLAMLLILPAVIVLIDRRRDTRARPMSRLNLSPLLTGLARRRRAMLVAAGAVIVACIVILVIPGPV